MSVKNRVRPNANKFVVEAIERSGHRWVRARVRVKSKGRDSFDLSTSDFRLVDSNGQRYMPDFQAFEPALGEGSLKLSERRHGHRHIGFQVPDAVEASEVRFAGLGGGEPFIWKVEQPRTPLCDDPCIGVNLFTRLLAIDVVAERLHGGIASTCVSDSLKRWLNNSDSPGA